jgi:hypothetical protein
VTDYRHTPATTRAPLPPRLEEELQRQLEPGERVVWVGQPTMRWALRRAVWSFLFASIWYGFLAVFASLGRQHWELLLFVSVFALMGLVVLGALFAELRAPYRCFYALTDRRALLVLGARRTDVRSFPPEAIGPLRLVERTHDGDLVLAHDRVPGESGWEQVPVGFLGITDARVAHDHVVRLLRDARRAPDEESTAEQVELHAAVDAARRRG